MADGADPSRRRSDASTHILLVDSDPRIHRLLLPILEAGGYQVTAAHNGLEALADIYQLQPDLVLLEIEPAADEGWQVLREARGFYGGGIIALSESLGRGDHLRALEEGADEHMEKPFSVAELLARIRSVLRLNAPSTRAAHVYRGEGLEIDFERRIVVCAGESLRLTPQEADVLGLLARSAGRTVTHGQLMVEMGPNAHRDVRHLRVIIAQVRRKLEGGGRVRRRIRTVPGVGYVFDE